MHRWMNAARAVRKEAIDSELYIAGKDHVNYSADYDVKAYAEEGTQKLYQGPGEKLRRGPGCTRHRKRRNASYYTRCRNGGRKSLGCDNGRWNRGLDESGEDRRMAERTSGSTDRKRRC